MIYSFHMTRFSQLSTKYCNVRTNNHGKKKPFIIILFIHLPIHPFLNHVNSSNPIVLAPPLTLQKNHTTITPLPSSLHPFHTTAVPGHSTSPAVPPSTIQTNQTTIMLVGPRDPSHPKSPLLLRRQHSFTNTSPNKEFRS